MADPPPPTDEVRASELVAALCLATDLGMGFPLEHGLHSTIVAMRIADRVGVDAATAAEAYYGCLLLYVGCTADAEVSAELFVDGALLEHFTPVAFGSPLETLRGIARALGDPERPAPVRLLQGALRLPKAGRGHRQHVRALCFGTSAVALVVLSRRLAADPRWAGLAPVAATAGVLALLAFVASGAFVMPDDAPLHEYAGLVQRAMILALLFPCRVWLSVRMLRLARPAQPWASTSSSRA